MNTFIYWCFLLYIKFVSVQRHWFVSKMRSWKRKTLNVKSTRTLCVYKLLVETLSERTTRNWKKSQRLVMALVKNISWYCIWKCSKFVSCIYKHCLQQYHTNTYYEAGKDLLQRKHTVLWSFIVTIWFTTPKGKVVHLYPSTILHLSPVPIRFIPVMLRPPTRKCNPSIKQNKKKNKQIYMLWNGKNQMNPKIWRKWLNMSSKHP